MKYLLTTHETERLRFRLLEDGDFNTWVDLFHADQTARFLGMDKIETAHARCETWFQRVKERYANDKGGMNVLICKDTDRLVGQCGLLVQEVDGIQELEIGYSILPDYRNKGYAGEAAKKCRDYAFENSLSETLISIIHLENKKSEMVALKTGMKYWKTTVFKDIPANVYRITKSDWEQQKQ